MKLAKGTHVEQESVEQFIQRLFDMPKLNKDERKVAEYLIDHLTAHILDFEKLLEEL